jgi:acyl carrier protein
MDREQLRQAMLAHLHEEKEEVPAVLSDDLNLRDALGLDSIDLVSLVISIQEHFNIELKTDELEKAVNVGDMLDLIQAKVAARRSAA